MKVCMAMSMFTFNKRKNNLTTRATVFVTQVVADVGVVIYLLVTGRQRYNNSLYLVYQYLVYHIL